MTRTAQAWCRLVAALAVAATLYMAPGVAPAMARGSGVYDYGQVYGAAAPPAPSAAVDTAPSPASNPGTTAKVSPGNVSDTTADGTASNPRSPAPKLWEATLGAGLAFRPTYEGSDHYTVSPLPVFSLTYDDMISLGGEGLSLYWHRRDFRLGIGLGYGGGRKDSKGNGIFSGGDDRLRGLGNIDSALSVKAFGSYRLGSAVFSGSVTKFTGGANDGILATAGLALPDRINDRLTITPHFGATWADREYMRTYFGITAQQSANSGFSPFTADAAIKDLAAGVSVHYQFNPHWFIGANADVKELIGDAANSPISFSDVQVRLVASAGYRF